MEARKTANEKDNEFKIKDNEEDTSYTISLSNIENNLNINISEDFSVPSINYVSKFTLNDLVKQSRYFKLFESIDEVIPELRNLFNEKKIKFKKQRSLILLSFSLPLKIVEEVFLTIPQAEIDSKKIITDLCVTVNDLRKQIKSLGLSWKISEEQLAKNLQSNKILLNEDEKKMVFDWILKQMKSENKQVKVTLLYKLTRDGDSSNTFHNKCNNQGYTLTLIRNVRGYRCGGFVSQNWTSCGSYVSDPNAFLFSLDYKEQYFIMDGNKAFYDNSSYGPTFGDSYDIYIANNCSQNMSSYCDFPKAYGGIKARCLSGGYYNFKVNEIQVFKIDII